MSGTLNSQRTMTRRGFLATTAGFAVACGAGLTACANDSDEHEGSENGASERTAYTYHLEACNGNCSLKCTVRDGYLVNIEPNDALEGRYRRCCVKGLSEIQHIYGPSRIQRPLKRVGERGSGEFEAISWDEAMEIVGQKLRETREAYGNESVFFTCSGAPEYPLLTDVLGATTAGLGDGLDMGTANGFDPAFGISLWASAANDSRDWVHSKTMLMFGTNYLESSMMQGSAFFDAQEAGCNIVVVDPHFSMCASKADTWIPIKPGTDAAMMLAMISVILEEGLYDVEYLTANTSFPFLIDESGAMVRDPGFVAAESIPVMGDNGYVTYFSPDDDIAAAMEHPFFVWDESTGSAVPYLAEDASPALAGRFNADGKTYKTAFQALLENQAEYTPEWAEGVCGVPADTIRNLARTYAEAGPATIALGYGGSDKYSNADIVGHSAVILGALTGNIGIEGGSVGYFGGGGVGYSAEFAGWELPEDMVTAVRDMLTFKFRTEPNNTHAVISVGNTFQTYFSNMNLTREWLDTLDFILCIEVYNSDSVQYADVVLPATSKFECRDDVEGIRSAFNHIRLKEKVIEPLFECKTDFEIQYEICKSLGLESVLPQSALEYVRHRLEASQDEQLAGVTLEDIVDNQGVWPLAGIEETMRYFADQFYFTPSTKLEPYYEKMLPWGQALPRWEENLEINDDNPLRSDYPLQLTQIRTKYRVHSQFCDAAWIQQFCSAFIELNPVDMRDRGLVDEDSVRVFNGRGEFVCKVHGNQAVRPGSARMYEGMWSEFIEKGNLQDVTNDAIVDRGSAFTLGPVLPFNDTLVEIERA